jgi:hypothetical protein
MGAHLEGVTHLYLGSRQGEDDRSAVVFGAANAAQQLGSIFKFAVGDYSVKFLLKKKLLGAREISALLDIDFQVVQRLPEEPHGTFIITEDKTPQSHKSCYEERST